MAADTATLLAAIQAALAAAGRPYDHFVQNETDLTPVMAGIVNFLVAEIGTSIGTSLTSSAPQDVLKQTAAVGTALTAARADHKHQVSTGTPGTIGVGDAAAEGTATSLARSDHTHALTAPAAPADVTRATAAAGSATTVARSDHKHDISTAAAGTTSVGDAAAEGTATSLARSDHKHALTAPAAPADVTKATASAGSATTVARSDHKHDVSTAAPSTIGTANSEGSATSLARSDHVHNHGAQTDGSLHAAAVSGGASGFLTGADKASIDSLATWVTRKVYDVSSQTNLTRDASNNATRQITHGAASINLVRLSGISVSAVYSNNAACPNPWMTVGDFDGQIVILMNNCGGSVNIQINTTALPNIRLEANSLKSVTPQDYITFIWNATDSRWDQLTSLIALT